MGQTILQADNPVSEADEIYLSLNVRLPTGEVLPCLAAEGFNLVELMRSSGLPVKAECAGSGVCATCHVQLDDAWREFVEPPTDDELDKLDEIAGAGEASRLACQIRMRDDLDGLTLTLQPDSLAEGVAEAAE